MSNLDSMLAVHVVQGTEYERGWGSRPDGYLAFPSKDAADKWIASYSEANHTSSCAPDEYTVYEYIGLKQCTKRIAESVATSKIVPFSKLSELTK